MAYAGSVSTRRRLAGRLGLVAGSVGRRAGEATAPEVSGSEEMTEAAEDNGWGEGGDGDRAVERANVVITSYNVLRTDVGVLGGEVRAPGSLLAVRALRLYLMCLFSDALREERRTGLDHHRTRPFLPVYWTKDGMRLIIDE